LRLGCCGCQRFQIVSLRDQYAEKHGVPVDMPLLTLQCRIRCPACNARVIHITPESYSIEHDVLGKPRD
jgi:hypothetical protein